MATTPLDTVLALLPSAKGGNGQYTAQCPAHEDKSASLRVSVGKDGKALLHCHAGCDLPAILTALNLQETDLFPPKAPKAKPVIVATYDYTDETGTLLYQSVRYKPKTFRQRQPDGKGGWVWNLKDVRRVLYRLSDIINADPDATIIKVEGEKDADRLCSLGLIATTNAQGADSWLSEYAGWLAARHVAVIPDNDDAGRQHANDVLLSLDCLATSRKLVTLPGLPEKGDVSDWLDQGHDADELKAIIESTPEWQPQSAPCVQPLTLAEVHRAFQTHLYLPDTDALDVILASYAANRGPNGTPLWLLYIAPPGAGKTEKLMAVNGLPDAHVVGSITVAGLLSGTSQRERSASAKGGLLRQIGQHGTLILKDFGSVLSMNRDARAEVLAALREIFDGRYVRYVGSDGGTVLDWAGKVGLIGGVTPAIDEHHAVIGSLGERFLLFRDTQLSREDEESLASRALDFPGDEEGIRAELRAAVVALFMNVPDRITQETICETERRWLIAVARFAVRARATVTRESTGSRIIEMVHGAEAPTRLVIGLRQLFSGLVAIGLDRGNSWRIVRKVALDSMPRLRHRAIDLLASVAGTLPTSTVAVHLDHPTMTTRRALEELEAYHLIVRHPQGPGKPDLWELSGYARDAWQTMQTLPADVATSLNGATGSVPEMLEDMGATLHTNGKIAGGNHHINYPSTTITNISGKVPSEQTEIEGPWLPPEPEPTTDATVGAQIPLSGQAPVDRQLYESLIASGVDRDEALRRSQIGPTRVQAREGQG